MSRALAPNADPADPADHADDRPRLDRTGLALALATWALTWLALLTLDGPLDLANLALLLVLGAAVASCWLPVGLALASGTLAVLAFNWAFVPPRHQFNVDLRQHAWLLLALLVVNGIVASLMAARQAQARQASLHARRARQLVRWSARWRDTDDPHTQAAGLAEALAQVAQASASLMLLQAGQRADAEPASADAALCRAGAAVDADQRAGLWHALRQAQALGPGTGRHEDQPDLYLPLRSQPGLARGAAVLRGPRLRQLDTATREHLQALCDLAGAALQRQATERAARQAREEAQAQALRNALLAAISHDYRTPLATVLGAASSLDEQGDRLDAAQRQRLVRRIIDETHRLARLTDNTLQLARLDAPGVPLRCDWESAEDLIGAALGRARRQPAGHRVQARLEPGLPLLWCDALLISQLLDNLVDNALKHSPDDAPVALWVQQREGQHVLSVRDRGPGIAPAWREQIFTAFHRGAAPMAGAPPRSADPGGSEPAGFGVGLAVCRAIARAHGGELRVRARGHGGSAFECWLPQRTPPVPPPPSPGPEAA